MRDVAPAPGGVAPRSAPERGQPSSSSTSSSSSPRRGSSGLVIPATLGTADGRTRGDHPVTGNATTRTNVPPGDLVSFPFYGPWGPWYPWYSAGFYWNSYLLGYGPWDYAGTCWGWGRYGAWYDPFGYCWGGDAGYYGDGGGGGAAPKVKATTGTLRLRVDPSKAKVYIDDAFAGNVDEFNGLGDHLEVEFGRHTIKFVADGYVTHSMDINVEAGRTQTVRASLKKK